MVNSERKLLTIKQASVFLGVNPATIRRWAQDKKLKGIKVGTRGDWRFTEEALTQMIQIDKKTFLTIKKFLKENVEEIYTIARTKHLEYLGSEYTRAEYLDTQYENYKRIIVTCANNLENLKKGTILFQRLAKIIAKDALDKGLTLEEAADGTIFLKQAFWERLSQDGLLYDLTTQEFYALSHVVATYADIVASKIAFAFHRFYKENEEQLRDNEERLRLAVDAGEIGIWDWYINEDRIIWSDQTFLIHGVHKKDFKGTSKEFINLIHPEDKDMVWDSIQSAVQSHTPYKIDLRIIRPSGEVRWLTTSAKVFYKNGKPIRMIGATSDITDRKRLMEQKDEFLGIASHELKTPLTSIKAYEQVLQKHFQKKGDEKSVQLLERLDNQVDKLNNLIVNLLDVTKIQAGKLQLEEKEFDGNALIREVVEELQETTEKHKIVTNLARKLPMYGDRFRIGQVLVNFLSNAIKYSPNEKNIVVTSQKKKDAVIVCVQDFGIGIPVDKQDHLFERFFRVENGDHTKFPGLGLGLYISSEIIKRQGGKIWVESEKGKGSLFCFMLPLKNATN